MRKDLGIGEDVKLVIMNFGGQVCLSVSYEWISLFLSVFLFPLSVCLHVPVAAWVLS